MVDSGRVNIGSGGQGRVNQSQVKTGGFREDQGQGGRRGAQCSPTNVRALTWIWHMNRKMDAPTEVNMPLNTDTPISRNDSRILSSTSVSFCTIA